MDHPAPAGAPDDGAAGAADQAVIDQAVIDQALLLVADRQRWLLVRLAPASAAGPPPPLAELRRGRFGRDLQRLAAVGRGELREPRERVLLAIEAAVQLLFWAAAADDYAVPRAFWDTELGRLLARAKYRAFAPAELVGIGDAAQRLGVSRPTIYRWLDDRALDSVRDELSGRTFALRRDVERRQQAAAPGE